MSLRLLVIVGLFLIIHPIKGGRTLITPTWRVIKGHGGLRGVLKLYLLRHKLQREVAIMQAARG